MLVNKRWNVNISIDEQPEHRSTVARAHLRCDDGHHYTGLGAATRFPRDPELPGVGDDLAVARALGELARQLTSSAYADIDDADHRLSDET